MSPVLVNAVGGADCQSGVAPVWWTVNCFEIHHCTAPKGDSEIAPPWSIVDSEVTVRSSLPGDRPIRWIWRCLLREDREQQGKHDHTSRGEGQYLP